jgi:predicted metal-dependent HD superfamily phosphohydrolase
MLNQTFLTLTQNYTPDNRLANDLWAEIETNYSNKKRHYHTLAHLENLLAQLTAIKGQIKNWDTVLFTLFYHDIVYNSLKKDNEEKSAELADSRLKSIAVPQSIIDNCKAQILATKQHLPSHDADTNYFTDADLSILGADWETYSVYSKQVRKEYSIYPALIYNPGRKKVLEHFLKMGRIFKTDYFFAKFEAHAKENLQRELNLLS